MPPPRGGVQAASVVCGDHPELITYAELRAGCHMGTGPMRSRPICESERLIVWLPLSRGYVAPWRGQRSQWNFSNVHREPLLGANSCVAS